MTGKMIYANLDGTAIGDGCTAYMKYGIYLRKIETQIGSIVGVDGGIDAVRRSLFVPMNAGPATGFCSPLRS